MLFNSSGNKVEHYRVHYTGDNKLTVDEEAYFENLTKLVEVGTTLQLLIILLASDTYLKRCIVT